MLELELRKGRFGLLSDTIYSNLEDDAATGEDRIRIKATANMLIQGSPGPTGSGRGSSPISPRQAHCR